MVHLIMFQTALKLNCPLLDLYESFGWDLYDEFDHAHDSFRLILTHPELVFPKIDEITEIQKNALVENIEKKMGASAVKLRSTFKL